MFVGFVTQCVNYALSLLFLFRPIIGTEGEKLISNNNMGDYEYKHSTALTKV